MKLIWDPIGNKQTYDEQARNKLIDSAKKCFVLRALESV